MLIQGDGYLIPINPNEEEFTSYQEKQEEFVKQKLRTEGEWFEAFKSVLEWVKPVLFEH